MKPEISPLRCVAAFVAELSIKANLGFKPEKEIALRYDKLDIDSVVLPPAASESQRQVTLKISQDATVVDNTPYSFSVEMVGFFEAEGVQESELERFIYIHGSSVLYGMARAALNDAMTKGPFVAVFLPLVSFYKSSDATGPKKTTAKKAPKSGRVALPKRTGG